MTNDSLKSQRLISIRDLSMKAHGYARIPPGLPSREPPSAGSHVRWCGEGGLDTHPYSIRASRIDCTELPYIMGLPIMDTTTVNKFRDSLKSFVEQVVSQHMPLRVTRRTGADFVVMSAEDWERDQETLYVLQNTSLMRQIAESSATHNAGAGYTPNKEQLDEIVGI